MKKLFIAVLFSIFITCCYGQDVKVNINNNDATATDDCAFRINGICSSEDIGGVDLELIDRNNINNNLDIYAVLTNYNSFPVTVVFRVYGIHDKIYKTFNVVLGVSGVKEVLVDKNSQKYLWSVEGMIVRKLAQ